MSEEDQKQEEQGEGGAQPELGNIANSILMAFNLGVNFNQQVKGTKSLPEVVGELGNTIYTNLVPGLRDSASGGVPPGKHGVLSSDSYAGVHCAWRMRLRRGV